MGTGTARLIAATVLGTLALGGCLNQVGPRRSTSSSPAFSIFTGSTSDAITVSKVLRTQSSPSVSIDLLGLAAYPTPTPSGTPTPSETPVHGELGSFCQPGGGSSFTCSCVISVTTTTACPTSQGGQDGGSPGATPTPTPSCTPASVTVEKRYQPLYVESDLVRCGIPTDLNADSFQIRLENSNIGRSNALDFTLTPKLSVKDPLFYTDVSRYACRWSPFVPHMMDPAMIDPAQSDSADSTLSLIFYTTNMGRAMAEFSALPDDQQAYFQCPPHASPTKTSLAVSKSDGTSMTNLASKDGTPIGDDTVNFVLARAPGGPFQVKLSVSQAPGIPANPPLGYAAAPDDSGDCPEVELPTGLEWRKLWLFRGSLDHRTRWNVPRLQTFGVACNPGKFQNDTTKVAEIRTIPGPIPSPPPTTPTPVPSPIPTPEKVVSYFPNHYYSFPDCGKYGIQLNKGTSPEQTIPIEDTGTNCGPTLTYDYNYDENGDPDWDWRRYQGEDSANSGQERILLPITQSSGSTTSDAGGSSIKLGDHRCVTFSERTENEVTTWDLIQDRCQLSINSCYTHGQSSLTDPLKLCKAKGNDELNVDFSSLTEVNAFDIPAPVEYLFYTTTTDVKNLGNLQILRPRDDSSGSYESYTNVTNINGARFPLCVLRRTSQ